MYKTLYIRGKTTNLNWFSLRNSGASTVVDFLILDFQASKKKKDSNKAMVGAVRVDVFADPYHSGWFLTRKNTERIVSFRFIRRQPAVQPAASAVQPNMLKTRFLAALEVVGFPSIHLSFRRMVLENKNTLAKFKIAPEKWWLGDYFPPIGKVTFQGLY